MRGEKKFAFLHYKNELVTIKDVLNNSQSLGLEDKPACI